MIGPAITAVGAITSVGRDAATTCASIRAGIVRSAPVDDFLVLDNWDYAEVPLTGCPVAGITSGFSNVGRWLQLASRAVEDLVRNGALPVKDQRFWFKTRLEIVVPALDERFPEDLGITQASLDAGLAKPLLKRLTAVGQAPQARVLPRGCTGVLDALIAARDELKSGGLERVIVVAVDSLVDATALQWLGDQSRLKCDVDPTGLTPGEAAVAIMVEAPSAAAARGAKPLAELRSLAVSETKGLAAGNQGKALAQAIEKTIKESQLGSAYSDPAIVDLNGENWRAEQLGYAVARVPRAAWSSDGWIIPAMSTGDVGAASAALHLAIATASFARGYAHGSWILMCCSDERGRAGAVLAYSEGYSS